MEDIIDIGQTISADINELIQKNESNTIQNDDFTKTWCDLVMLPAAHIEYIIQTSVHTHKGYNRDEAVIYGQLIRIQKMLCFQRRLVCKRIMTTELAGFFERMILEDNINLQYFVLNYQSSQLNDFRVHSLKPEVFFEKSINDDIKKNGGKTSSWQTKLLSSIHNTYNKAGISYEEVRRNKTKVPNISDKFRSTGNQRLYDIAYRTKCHTIHGDWVDITQNYLNYHKASDTFSPNFQEHEADIRQLNQVLITCCDTITKFIKDFSGHGISQDLCTEVAEDQQLIVLLEEMHDNFLNKRDLLDGIESPMLQ